MVISEKGLAWTVTAIVFAGLYIVRFPKKKTSGFSLYTLSSSLPVGEERSVLEIVKELQKKGSTTISRSHRSARRNNKNNTCGC